MSRPVVYYSKDLPEIEGRNKYERPTSYLEKIEERDEYKIVQERRESLTLLVNELRKSVDKWREDGYPKASKTTLRLFNYWFDEDHLYDDGSIFKFYFCQREAIETLVYVCEILKNPDIIPLIKKFARVRQTKLEDASGVLFQTAMDGSRQIRRFFDEKNKDGIQDLPPENLRRYAIKMATGTGKTLVMAMTIVWAYFNKIYERNSVLSTNFLIIAPNVIVYQRLEKDFSGGKIFRDYHLIPPEWNFNLKITLRDQIIGISGNNNLVVTNIQQMYETRVNTWKPRNAVDVLLGELNPRGDERSIFNSVSKLSNLIVMNDEAHHVHDEGLVWNQTLISLNNNLPGGLSLWLDFTATPKDQKGTFYPWIISDYPLAQAVEDRIVKAPIIVHQLDMMDPGDVTGENIIQKYGDWIINAFRRWKEHYAFYGKLGKRPVLFIMCTKSSFADRIGKWLIAEKKFNLAEEEVLIIHTDSSGDLTKGDLENARKASRDIDLPSNKIKVIVSVMMLREGWDVRNVTVVLGLRPFSAKANILPEQAVGRGLRLMSGISPDSTQTLEVIGTEAFEDFVRELEKEGVGVETYRNVPNPPIWIEPILERKSFDISLPLTKPMFFHSYKRFEKIKISDMAGIREISRISESHKNVLRMEFATTRTTVGSVEFKQDELPVTSEIITSIAQKAAKESRLTGQFSRIYPIVKQYLQERCFGKAVNLEDNDVKRFLTRTDVQDMISIYLSKKFGEILIEKRKLEFEQEHFKLSHTQPFSWRRNHTSASKTIFNFVSTFNGYESKFAEFLDQRCEDVLRFSSLAEQFTRFRVNYLSSNGSLKFYYPDFVVVQKKGESEINWIIETKGRIYENVEYKDSAIRMWCDELSKLMEKGKWNYIRINQSEVPEKLFEEFRSFEALLDHVDTISKRA